MEMIRGLGGEFGSNYGANGHFSASLGSSGVVNGNFSTSLPKAAPVSVRLQVRSWQLRLSRGQENSFSPRLFVAGQN